MEAIGTINEIKFGNESIQDSPIASSIGYKIQQCGKNDIILICLNPECPDFGKYYAIQAKCHNRLCPKCARDRALKWFHRLKNLRFQYPIHLVLTLKVVQDLPAGLDLIIKSFRSFRRAMSLNRGVYSIEINKSACGGWYIHLHALINAIWLDGEKVSKVWRKLTGSYVKSIRRVRDKEKSIREVCKYISKGLITFQDSDLVYLDQSIASRRLINFWGLSYGCSLLDTEETSIQKYVCPICGSRLHYQEKVDGREAMRRFLDRKLLFYDPAWSKVQEVND